MKSPLITWLVPLFLGWLGATITYLVNYSIFFDLEEDYFYVVAFIIGSFFLSLVLNLFFVFPFRKKLALLRLKTHKTTFALILSVYGFVISMPFVYWFSGIDFAYPKHRLIFLNAVANGFVYGLAYHYYYKPKTQLI